MLLKNEVSSQRATSLLPYVSFVIDTALSADHVVEDVTAGAVLVGWQCGFEPMFVAVISHYVGPDGRRDPVDVDEAEQIALDFITEHKWFAIGPREPDHVVTV